MASRSRGCLSSIFLASLAIAAIVFSIFNMWQISALKRQVSDLQTKVAELKVGKQGADSSSANFALADEARKHIEQATKLIAKGNLKDASVELQKSLRKLDRLPRIYESPSWTLLEDMRRKLDQTSNALEKIWSNQSRQPVKSNKGGQSK